MPIGAGHHLTPWQWHPPLCVTPCGVLELAIRLRWLKMAVLPNAEIDCPALQWRSPSETLHNDT